MAESKEQPGPVLLVRDLGATLAFYADRLGFDVLHFGEDEFGSASRDGATILFAHVDDYDAVLADPAAATEQRIHVQVDDVDALHTEFAGRGASIAEPLRDGDDGYRAFVTRDPDGHEIAFLQPLA